MTVKKTFAWGLLLLAGAMIAWTQCTPNSDESSRGPNRSLHSGSEIKRQPRSILLITVDTTRADRLEPYGATDVETPVMAELAREGIVFENAISVAPITLVAHTSILTGLYPPQHGVRNNGTHYVPDELTTLAERLLDEGYRTGAFVSASVLEKRYGLTQGFEHYDDDLSTGRERHPRMVPDRPAEATVDATRAWLDGIDPEQDFFAWVHLYDPHASYSPPPPYRDTYRQRLYDGEIAYMDAQIGRLLEHPRLAQDQDLIVTVLGDHGESLGEHGEQSHAILAYDSTLHVPWILQVRGGPRSLRYVEPVSHVDLVPTLLDIVDAAPQPGVAGRSLRSALAGSAPPPSSILYAETYLPYYTYGWSKVRVMRRGAMKLIEAPTMELYDLRRDPRELSNLYEQQPGVRHDLERDLSEFLSSVGDPERETSLELDSDAIDKLRSLGYVAVGQGSDDTGVRTDPKEAIHLHVGLERARRLLRDRLYPQAIRRLRQVLEEDANNLAALTDLATALESDGQIDDAVRTLEKALSIDPDFANLQLQLAGVESRRGNVDKSLELTLLALELQPQMIEARLQKAQYLQQLKRPDEARGEIAAVVAEHPDHPRANALHTQLIELRDGDFEAAAERLRKTLERDPFLVLAWRLLGDVQERLGQLEEARQSYRNGLTRQPDDALLHQRLGLLLARTGGSRETEMHLREAIRLANQFRPELHVALGGWMAEHGRPTEAEAEYRQVLERQPRHPGARNNLAIALYRTGDADRALEELNQLVKDFPRHADAHNNLAAIAIEQRRWQDAEAAARKSLDIDPKQAEGWNNLGVALEEQSRRKKAETAYLESLSLNPDYWQARFNLGVVLAKTDRPADAIAALERVLEQVPSFAECHFELAELYAGPQADPQRARKHYNAFIRAAGKQHPKLSQARQRLRQLPPP